MLLLFGKVILRKTKQEQFLIHHAELKNYVIHNIQLKL